ncbi:MAG: tRNA threonylcarbamoyladenosine dehydratase [Luteolibacter sp.]
MSDSLTRFGGIARLYGQAALERFLGARVAVIGVGGVGSWAVEALARSGIGHLTLVDLDEICLTNVNRQLHAMDGQIGRQKTDAMADRIRAIHPACEVEILHTFFTGRNADSILDSGFDAVIDAIDSLKHKALLIAGCHRRGLITVTCGGAGGRRDPSRIRVADLAFSGKDPLLGQLRRTLRSDHGFPKFPQGVKPDPLNIDAVFTDEPAFFPQNDGSVSCERPADSDLRLNCNSGYGTAAHVTASFGFFAAGRVLEKLAGN